MKYFIVIMLLLCSCKNEKNNEKITEVNLNNTYQKTYKINLSDLASRIDYIQLETDSLCLVGTFNQPNKQIKFFDNSIFINSGEILRFNTSGKYMNKIGVIGKGPGEFVGVNNFVVTQNKDEEIVNIFSAAQQKSLFYNFKGEFMGEMAIKFWPTGLNSLKGDLLSKGLIMA
jgi:hypothetical protein